MSQLKQNTTNLDALIAKANALPDAGSGGGSLPSAKPNDVQYIDYDGTILYSYSAAQFASLSSEPALPMHDGLICQGWNWDFARAKEYVAECGKLFVGATYITDDGKTRIYIRLEKGRLSPYLGIAVDGTCVVDWGDGSTDTVTGTSTSTVINTQHIYAKSGIYVISIEVVSGTIVFIGQSSYGSKLLHKNSTTNNENRCYQSSILRIELGNGIERIGNYAFHNCHGLRTVTIPSSITTISVNSFHYCFGLQSIIIPINVTSIAGYVFVSCRALQRVVIPDNIASVGNQSFSECYALQNVTIPDSVESISSSAFSNCYALQNVTIPDSVESISSSAFSNCGLGEIHFKSTVPPKLANSNAFSNLPTDCIIYVPSGSLSAYTSATNYPDPATYTYMEE